MILLRKTCRIAAALWVLSLLAISGVAAADTDLQRGNGDSDGPILLDSDNGNQHFRYGNSAFINKGDERYLKKKRKQKGKKKNDDKKPKKDKKKGKGKKKGKKNKTAAPSTAPSGQPSSSPSISTWPSEQPSDSPSMSSQPSEQPSTSPSVAPSEQPSFSPSISISPSTSVWPSEQPSSSSAPSISDHPSSQPSEAPTYVCPPPGFLPIGKVYTSSVRQTNPSFYNTPHAADCDPDTVWGSEENMNPEEWAYYRFDTVINFSSITVTAALTQDSPTDELLFELSNDALTWSTLSGSSITNFVPKETVNFPLTGSAEYVRLRFKDTSGTFGGVEIYETFFAI